jgi:hypothetical protein
MPSVVNDSILVMTALINNIVYIHFAQMPVFDLCVSAKDRT